MRAVRIHEHGGPGVLESEEDVSDPAIDAGAVLFQAVATSVNATDWRSDRQEDFPPELPAILGKNVCGGVSAIGDGVEAATLGTHATVAIDDDEALAGRGGRGQDRARGPRAGDGLSAATRDAGLS